MSKGKNKSNNNQSDVTSPENNLEKKKNKPQDGPGEQPIENGTTLNAELTEKIAAGADLVKPDTGKVITDKSGPDKQPAAETDVETVKPDGGHSGKTDELFSGREAATSDILPGRPSVGGPPPQLPMGPPVKRQEQDNILNRRKSIEPPPQFPMGPPVKGAESEQTPVLPQKDIDNKPLKARSGEKSINNIDITDFANDKLVFQDLEEKQEEILEDNHMDPDDFNDDGKKSAPHRGHKVLLLNITIISLVAALIMGALFIGSRNDISENKKKVEDLTGRIEKAESELTDALSQVDKYREDLGLADDSPELSTLSGDALAQELDKRMSALYEQISKLRKQLNQIRPVSEEIPALPPDANPTDPTAGKKICYLTFDDGPTERTLEILDILRHYNVKATFFVIGNTKKLNYIQQIHDEGHAIALHSDTHRYADIYKSDDAYFADLNAISEKVEKIVGFAPKIIRFPGGSSNTVSKKYSVGIMTRLVQSVTDQGYSYFDWNISSGDADSNSMKKEQLIENVKQGSKGKERVCILMHDSAGKKSTVAALPEIIEFLKAEGFSIEVITQSTTPFHHGVGN